MRNAKFQKTTSSCEKANDDRTNPNLGDSEIRGDNPNLPIFGNTPPAPKKSDN